MQGKDIIYIVGDLHLAQLHFMKSPVSMDRQGYLAFFGVAPLKIEDV